MNTTKLVAGDRETQAIYGFLRILRACIEPVSRVKVVVLWDGRSWRKDYFRAYKSNRDIDPKIAAVRDSYKTQRPMISKALKALGVEQRMAVNMEADDLAGDLVFKLSRRATADVTLISGDKDWLQLVRPGVIWFDFVRNRKVNHRTFRNFTGYRTPKSFVQGKALMGDISDCIPGVGGIGEKGAEAILKEYPSVPALWSAFEREDFELPESLRRYRKKITDFATPGSAGREAFVRNIKLMKLGPLGKLPVEVDRLTVTKGRFDADAFEDICAELSFHSILKQGAKWTQPFKALAPVSHK